MHYQPKNVSFGHEGRSKVIVGAQILARAVRSTMGAKGRKALSEREFDVLATLDGVTVAREINLEDKDQQTGVVLVREAAEKTNEAAGDGTTTATILTERMMTEGLKYLTSGVNSVLLAKGIEKYKVALIEQLKLQARKVETQEDLYAIALISSRDEQIAKIVSEVMHKVGNDGVVTVERAPIMDIQKEEVDGMQFPSGYSSYAFINNREKMASVIDEPFILLYDGKIKEVKDIFPLFEQIAKDEGSANSLVIIAEEVSGAALSTIHANNVKGSMATLVVNPPEYGERRKEFLKDLAALTGGTFCSPDLGKAIKDVQLGDLGRARTVIATKQETTIVEGKGKKEDIEGRIAEIRKLTEAGFSEFEKDKLRERIARMKNGVVIIKVGAPTSVAVNEKLDRVDDALGAVRSAVAEGVVPGGGTALIRAGQGVDIAALALGASTDELAGMKLLESILPSCCETIADNAGYNGKTIVDKVKEAEGNIGFDVMTGELADLIKARVIDPVKVARIALENSVSVACMFLTADTIITWKDMPQVAAKE